MRSPSRLTARLSEKPAASLARKSAEHGATTMRSAQRRSSMCRIGSPTCFQS